MKLSSAQEVVDLYDNSAANYEQMMDDAIESPLYEELLTRLARQIKTTEGAVVDTSCGTGHMLAQLREILESKRELCGIDLSPKMVQLAGRRLEGHAELVVGEMSELSGFKDDSCAALISFFAVHHVGPEVLSKCFLEWSRVLAPGGKVLLAAWEGEGAIDYGDFSNVSARYYTENELLERLGTAGFFIDSHSVRWDADMSMNAVYVMAGKMKRV